MTPSTPPLSDDALAEIRARATARRCLWCEGTGLDSGEDTEGSYDRDRLLAEVDRLRAIAATPLATRADVGDDS